MRSEMRREEVVRDKVVLFTGIVTAYDEEHKWYMIQYEDDDKEELNLKELREVLDKLPPSREAMETPLTREVVLTCFGGRSTRTPTHVDGDPATGVVPLARTTSGDARFLPGGVKERFTSVAGLRMTKTSPKVREMSSFT